MDEDDTGETEAEPQLMIEDDTLQDFFKVSKRDTRVTRGQLLGILRLYAQKVDVQQAMQVLAQGLSANLQQMIKEEREQQGAENEGGILLLP